MNHPRLVVAAAFASLAAATVPIPAVAQPKPSLGEPGHLAISSDAQGNVQFTSNSNGRGTDTSILLAPAADYFVVRNVSVGVRASWSHIAFADEPTTDSESVGLRVGYNFPLGDLFSFWPRLGFSYLHSQRLVASVSTGATGVGSLLAVESVDGVSFEAFAPLLVHPVPHAFLGLGPNLSTQLAVWPSGAGLVTQYGLMFTLGMWFGG